jgi:hypothetical protein
MDETLLKVADRDFPNAEAIRRLQIAATNSRAGQ